MNLDLGSGRGISYHAHFKRALIQIEPCRKTADSPVLRQKPVISPGNVSDGESTLPRSQKKNISRDTNHLLFPDSSPEEGHVSRRRSPEQALIRKLGTRF